MKRLVGRTGIVLGLTLWMIHPRPANSADVFAAAMFLLMVLDNRD